MSSGFFNEGRQLMLELIKVSKVAFSIIPSLGAIHLDKCGPLKCDPDEPVPCDPAVCMVVPCIPNSTVCDPKIEICYPHYDTP
jgi:hypothetical protein